MQLAQAQRVLPAHQFGRDNRRTRIVPEPVRIHAADHVQPRRQRGANVRRRAAFGIPDTADAIAPFRAARRLVAGEIVPAAAGVRVDITVGRILRIQPVEAQREHDVFQDVGEVPGVKGVAIVHLDS